MKVRRVRRSARGRELRIVRHSAAMALVVSLVAGLFVALGPATVAGASPSPGGAGAAYAWGDNGALQLGDGLDKQTVQPTAPSGLPGSVSKVAAYGGGTLALVGGTWFGWGYGADGPLCNGNQDTQVLPAPTGFAPDDQLAGGGYHVVARRSDGSVQACGLQLGPDTFSYNTSLLPIEGLSSGVASVEAGYLHSLAVMNDGTVRTWGYNGSGQLGDGTTTNSLTPVTVPGLSGVVAAAGGSMHSLALKSDGTVVSWGSNSLGELGNGTTTLAQVGSAVPVGVVGLTGVVAIAGANGWSMALKSDGTVWTWGGNFVGALGSGDGTDSNTPRQVPGLSGVTSIAASSNHGVALKGDGTVWTWGDNGSRQLGNSTTQNPGRSAAPIVGLSGVVAIGAGRDHTTALKSDGALVSWGGNVSGSSMATYVDQRSIPSAVVPPGDRDLHSISAGYSHALALTAAGDVIAWGDGSTGQLGDGGTSGSATPVHVSGLAPGVRQVETGENSNSFAVEADGTVRGWGSNQNGELGDGTTTSRFSPVSVTGLDGPVDSMSSGGFHSVAVLADGTVRAWGHGYFGNLGDGTTADRLSAVTVLGLTGIVSVATGSWSSFALSGGGQVYSWGSNSSGQLGDDSTTNRSTPGLVAGLSGIVAIAAGGDSVLALDGSGHVWAWGANWAGQLGDGTTVARPTPVQIPGLDHVTAVATSGYHSMALTADGSVLGWGYNYGGAIGDGTTTDASSPTPVHGLAGPATSIAAGYTSSYAILAAPAVQTSTAVTSSAATSTAGQSIDLTATVTPAGGSVAPTGSVTFRIDGVDQMPIPLVGGAATLSTASLSAGGHVVTATFVPATDAFEASDSTGAPVSVTVNPGALAVLTVSPPGVVVGASTDQLFTVRGADAFGNDLGDVTGLATFSITPNGTCAVNSCRSTTTGTKVVKATVGATSGTTTLIVRPRQTISFPAISATTLASATVSIGATATSGLPVTFSSATPVVCTAGGANGSTITVLSAGTCTVAANQGGNASWGPAVTVSRSFTVSKVAQTLSFSSITAKTLAVTSVPLVATATSGLSVTFSSATPAVCTVDGSTVTLLAAGTCSVRADQPGSDYYKAATGVTRSFTVSKVAQSITFASPGTKTLAQSPVTVVGTSGSGLLVTFSSTTPTVCTVDGTTVTLLAAGTCTVKADQPGDDHWKAATSLSRSFTVSKVAQSITFPTIAAKRLGQSPVTLAATSTSGLDVSFSSTTPAVCTVAGSVVTLLTTGTCTVKADQAGSDFYKAATAVSRSFKVNP